MVPSLDVSATGPDVLYEQDLLGKLRIRGESTDPDKALFIGIGATDDVVAFLDGVGYGELTDVDDNPFDLTTTPHTGGAPATEPTEQTFWAESVTGTGLTTLAWDVTAGDWAVVVMNADGTPGIRAEFDAGATLPVVRPIALWSLAAGAFLAVIGVAMIIIAVATRRSAP
jgi:hypothetical protein